MNDGTLELIRSGLFAFTGLLIPLVFAIAGTCLALWPAQTLAPLEALQKRMGALSSDKRSMIYFHRTYRILGVLFASFGFFVLTITVPQLMRWVLAPHLLDITPTVERGTSRWDLLAFGMLMVGLGMYTIVRAEDVVRRYHESSQSLILVTQQVMRAWILFYRLVGITAVVGALIMMVEWLISIQPR